MKISLCADDFGLNAAVSLGILELVKKQRLSAVSCMTNQPDFAKFGPELGAFKQTVSIGLHFNLTEGLFLSNKSTSFSLNALLIKSHCYWLDLDLVACEFKAQLQAFKEVMGFLPDFIDGHQHVHQFPGIRQVILQVYEKQLRANNTAIRSTYPGLTIPTYRFKAKILEYTGGRALQSTLQQLKIPHNAYFAGVYDFAKEADYRALFRQWLEMACDNTLIMCHPGKEGETSDVIGAARVKELAYFLSDAFLSDCEEFSRLAPNQLVP